MHSSGCASVGRAHSSLARVLTLFLGGVILVGSTLNPVSAPKAQASPSWCYEVESYSAALRDFSFALLLPRNVAPTIREKNKLENKARDWRKRALRALRSDRSASGVKLSRAWKMQNFKRAQLGNTKKWKTAAGYADETILSQCGFYPKANNFLI
jgi:hypothetical protein